MIKINLLNLFEANALAAEQEEKQRQTMPDYHADPIAILFIRSDLRLVVDLQNCIKNFPHDREILMEILELLVETVTSRKKFLRICGEEKPKEVVKSRLMKLDSMHIQYVMECLKSNTTQVRNIKQYLLATLYNAPTTIDSYYVAQVRHDFGWGGRSN